MEDGVIRLQVKSQAVSDFRWAMVENGTLLHNYILKYDGNDKKLLLKKKLGLQSRKSHQDSVWSCFFSNTIKVYQQHVFFCEIWILCW